MQIEIIELPSVDINRDCEITRSVIVLSISYCDYVVNCNQL